VTLLRRLIGVALLSGAVWVFSGCTVGPRYSKPDTPAPERFAASDAARSDAASSEPVTTSPTPPASDDAQLAAWWQGFADPQLRALVEKGLTSNLDLQTAASRIRQAREQEVIVGAARLPAVNASGIGARLHSKSNPLGGAAGGSASGGSAGDSSSATDLHLYSLGFDATWEVDLFGGTRRAVEASRANTEAAVWQLRDGEVSLTAEIANDYFALRTAQTRIALVQASIDHQRELLQLAEARQRGGLVTELDVNQQRTQLARSEAQRPALDAEAHAQINAIAVLLGQQPETALSELGTQPVTEDVLARDLPPGLPSDLLRRRPDIRAAERRLSAATADIGVAVAQLYPSFNLFGAASLASRTLNDLPSSRSFSALGLGNVAWPLFSSGKLRANVRSTEEQRNQAYFAYQEAVLTALQDAENALLRYSSEQRRLASLQESANAASSTREIAEAQYRSGIVTFTEVLTASTAELDARDEVAQSRQTLAQALVSLYKALGGGWTEKEQRG
jgi:NodT family efflux transporter outer membrane factor (OMF) lipoprotein